MSTAAVAPRRSRRRRQQRLERVLGTPALFATAYGNVGSSIYYALGLVAGIALGLTPLVFVISGVIFAATAATYAEGTVRFREAGGSSSFARNGFDELVSFIAAWAQMLNYVITIAISAFFVPHYLSIFWEPLRTNPWDIVGGAIVITLLVLLNIVGVREAANLNIFLAVVDFATQLLLVLGGFANDPVLGVVEHLGLHGTVLSGAKVYVGVLASTILFIATNAGVIGASRITYAMASHRQFPEIFRRLHPKFKTPWLSLLVFGGIISIAVLLPGRTTFLGDMYAFGAMLSFTIAHASIIALRVKRRDREMRFRARPHLRVGGVDWPLFAIFGGLGTAAAWLVVVVQKADARSVGFGWLVLGLILYAVYRRYVVHAPLRETVRAPVLIGPAIALEYRSILVPVKPGRESEEAIDFACRLAAERRSSIAAVSVVVVPLELPLDADLPEAEAAANEALDSAVAIGELYGVDVVGRLLRARSPGRAIVREAERRQTEIIVIGAPRADRPQRAIFSETVDFILKNAPSRVMVVAGKKAVAA